MLSPPVFPARASDMRSCYSALSVGTKCARYSGLKSQSANNTGSMRFGNHRPGPWMAVESKAEVPFRPSRQEKGPLLAGKAYTCVSLLIILIPVLFILQFSGCLCPFSAYFPVNVHVLPHPTSMVSVSGQ